LQKGSRMDSLDLSTRPPRSPSERLGGLLMLARTIDKLRATLPGGNLGPYYMRGFSATMLEQLGIEEEVLRGVVAQAKSDDDVLAYVREHSDESTYEGINALMMSRRIADRIGDPEFVARYPSIATLPREMPLLEMLDHDDRAMFPTP
jgi:hypothetical protein